MKIPRSFQVMGQTISVVFDDNKCHLNDCVGLAEWHLGLITLSRTTKEGDKINHQNIEAIFYHELIHIIHDACGVMLSSEVTIDERYITQIGALLHQAISTFNQEQ